jgi:hypothetical protein
MKIVLIQFFGSIKVIFECNALWLALKYFSIPKTKELIINRPGTEIETPNVMLIFLVHELFVPIF